MRRSPRILCLWPGLARLWLHGDPLSLLMAAAFAGGVQLAILTGIVWPELIVAELKMLLHLIVVSVWLIFIVITWRKHSCSAGQEDSVSADTLFREAQGEYLKGNWFQAEGLLRKVLRRNEEDVDARMTLAALYRRVHRYREAMDQLRQLEKLDLSGKWSSELRREIAVVEGLLKEPRANKPSRVEGKIAMDGGLPLSDAA